MPKKLTNFFVRQIALVDAGANQLAHVALMKRAPDAVTTANTTTTTTSNTAVVQVQLNEKATMADETKDTVATITTDLDSAQKAHGRVEQELEKARELLKAELKARTEELEASKAEVLKLNKQRRRERFIKLAHELSHLPGTMGDDFGETLDLIEKAIGQKDFEKFFQKLVSWNVVIEKNNLLFQEVGRDSGGLSFMSGPEAQMTALAKEKQEKNPKLTFAKAYTQVMAENPTLYKRYLAEKKES